MTPKTRKESYLAKAAGDDVSIPSPVTREEVYLNALATGEAEGLPDPITREEVFLKAAAEGGGGEQYPTGTINLQIHGTGYDEISVVGVAITSVGGSLGAMNISSKMNFSVPSGSGVSTSTIDNALMPEEGSYAHVTAEEGWRIQVISGNAEEYGRAVKVYGDCTLDLSRMTNYKSKLAQVVDRTVTEIMAVDLSGIATIGSNAFSGCSNLTSVSIPSGVTSIGSGAFTACSKLTSVNIPSGVTSIGQNAFANCSRLADLVIPSSVTSIDSNAFLFCGSITSIVIPSNVTNIGNSSFSYCGNLNSVTVEAITPPTLGSNAFNSTHADLVIYVPAASVSAYQSASGWSTYASKIQAIPNS